MVKKREILLFVILFIIVFAAFPLSIVKIADDESNVGKGDHQINALKTSEWDEGFNYTINDNYAYSWEEINETGTEFTSFFYNDDDGYNYTSFSDNGWNFTFYGTEYSYLNVSTNGWMKFCNHDDSWTCTYQSFEWAYHWDPIPQNCSTTNHENHNDTVILLGTDLVPGDHGQIFYQFFGAAPNRYLVIEYFEVEEYDTDDYQTMEAIFYENGNIKFQYKKITDPNANNDWYYADAKVGLDHGDLIHYSNYTNDWNKTFGAAVNELAVLFRLKSPPPTPLLSPDDDDDDEDTGVGVVVVVIIIIACVGGVVVVVIVLIKKGIIGTSRG